MSDRSVRRSTLFIVRGSSHAMRAHLIIAHSRSYLEDAELRDLSSKYEEIAKMLTGLIKYLIVSDRQLRAVVDHGNGDPGQGTATADCDSTATGDYRLLTADC